MKMKKKILSAAVLAALGSGAAQAVNVSQDGTGQVLLFPYYTVQGNEETYLHVVNTTGQGKAVKIRFREAYNSREVLDFHIYMSPYDMWTGVVTEKDGGAAIATYDNSCTVPRLPVVMPTDSEAVKKDKAIAFRPYRYTGKYEDSGPTDASRTREGYVEIIEMASIDVTPPMDRVIDADGDGHADFVHMKDAEGNMVPEDCNTFVKNWDPDDGTWATVDPTRGVAPPSGGLFGSLSIINVERGTQVSVNATALEAVYETVQHHPTGSDQPNLKDADSVSIVMVNDGAAINGQGAQVYESEWVGDYAGINAVSATLMASSIMNGYSFNPINHAMSAWVITFPTKWVYTDGAFQNDDPQWIDSDVEVVAPFTDAFADDDNGDGTRDGQACEEFTISESNGGGVWTREEGTLAPGDDDVDFSPLPPGVDPKKHYLCYEVNVLQFGEDSDVFSAANTVVRVTDLPGSKGWMKLSFASADHSMGDAVNSVNRQDHVYAGLPVIGFQAKVLRAVGEDGLANPRASYGSAVDHAYMRVVTDAAGGPAAASFSQRSMSSGE